MKLQIVAALLLSLLFAPLTRSETAKLCSKASLIPITFIKEVEGEKTRPQLYEILSEDSPEAVKARQLMQNDAADFIRSLHQMSQSPHKELLVALKKGGNYARCGLRLKSGTKISSYPERPYVVVALKPKSLSHTLLHEGGHALHHQCLKGKEGKVVWKAPTHTTFMVSDRTTALFEGYAIHFETMWAHFTKVQRTRNHYLHQSSAFGTSVGTQSEFYFPLRDLWSFAQTWSRYQAVRDGMTCFAGIIDGDDYLKNQFSPDRDRSRLRTGAQFIAAEGAVASFFFWLSTSRAMKLGALPGHGFSQAGIVKAEVELLAALKKACQNKGVNATVLDVVDAHYELFPEQRERLLKTFIDISRGVTADNSICKLWSELHDCSIRLDGNKLRNKVIALEKRRKSIYDKALKEPASLRKEIGTILPVRVPKITLQIPIFGSSFPLEFCLNAASRQEVMALRWITIKSRLQWLKELDKAPFASYEDFVKRTGISFTAAGLKKIL